MRMLVNAPFTFTGGGRISSERKRFHCPAAHYTYRLSRPLPSIEKPIQGFICEEERCSVQYQGHLDNKQYRMRVQNLYSFLQEKNCKNVDFAHSCTNE